LEPSHEGPLPPTYSFLGVDGEGVTLEAVKRAEASDDLIVRLVERHGADTSAVVTTDDAFESAADCNLLEESFVTLPASDATVRLDMRPYEIRTIRLQRNA